MNIQGLQPLLKLKNRLTSYWQDLPLATKGIVLNALPLTVLLASLALIFESEQQAALLESRVQNTLQIQKDIQALHTRLLEASTGVRDYLLTGNPAFLNGYHKANTLLPELVNNLQYKLDDSAQQDLLLVMHPLLKKNLEDLSALASNKDSEASAALIRKFASQGNALDQLRQVLDQMLAREAKLLALDKSQMLEERQRNYHITLLAVMAGVLGSLIGVWIFSNTLVSRVKTIRDSAGHLVKGEPLALPIASRDELGQLTTELEHTAQLLTRSANEAHQARIDAEEASAAKSQFLSRTSHELRTPLNAILGFAQILENDLPQGRQKDSAVLIHNAGKHLLKLINHMLDISRIESGDIAMAMEVVALSPLITEACDYIRPLGLIRDVSIQIHAESELFVRADRQRLLQVILNLLNNALKYGPENSTVDCRAYRINQHVFIEVIDQGKGIPPEFRNRLFVPFDRLGAERTMTEGTGLGLVLSKQLVDAMSGEIGVAEDVSKFWIKLPACECPTPPAPAPQQSAVSLHPQAPIIRNTSKYHMLYVEDNASNRALMEAMMSKHGHIRLHFAHTIQEALIWLRDMQPDILVIDLNLPDGSGEQLIRHCKKQAALQEVPVLVLSADASSDTKKRLQQVGITHYFTKPVNVSAFNQLLQQIFMKNNV